MNSGTGKYEQLLERCAGLAPVPTAVVYPCEETILTGALEAGRKGLIIPVLVGPAAKIQGIARLAGIALGETRIIDTPHSHGSAAKAVEMVREGCAEVLMKGSLHTDELLSAVITREAGLRTARRISHAFIMDVPRYCKVLIVTDAAINISPALEDKADICQNAIDLAVSLGLEKPRVAILAAASLQDGRSGHKLRAAFWTRRLRSTRPSARSRTNRKARYSLVTYSPGNSYSWRTLRARASSLAHGFPSS